MLIHIWIFHPSLTYFLLMTGKQYDSISALICHQTAFGRSLFVFGRQSIVTLCLQILSAEYEFNAEAIDTCRDILIESLLLNCWHTANSSANILLIRGVAT